MRNSFRKFSAIAAGLALSLTLAGPAYAATLDNSGVYTGKETAITINKAVIIANEEGKVAQGKTIAYPAVSYTYTVSPFAPNGETVTAKDEAGNINIAEVKAGLAGALNASKSTIDIDAGTVVLNKNGQEAVNGSITFTVNVNDYKNAGYGAGVYRYEIKESADKAALADKGVVRAATDKTYYLDVYLNNTSDGGLEPGGFVLSDDKNDITPEHNDKQGGFNDDVPVDPNPGNDPDDPSDDYKLKADSKPVDLDKNDHYLTYNVTLKKVVAGAMGDKSHGFAFTATVNNNGLAYQTEVTDNTTASLNKALASVDGTSTSVETALSNGGTLKVWGLSPLAKVNYSETNNTSSVYKTKIDTAANTQVKAEVELAANATLSAYGETQKVAETVGAEKHAAAADVVYTNTLNEISPTGVVMRFAPYVAMLAASMILLLGFKSNKAYEEE